MIVRTIDEKDCSRNRFLGKGLQGNVVMEKELFGFIYEEKYEMEMMKECTQLKKVCMCEVIMEVGFDMDG